MAISHKILLCDHDNYQEYKNLITGLNEFNLADNIKSGNYVCYLYQEEKKEEEEEHKGSLTDAQESLKTSTIPCYLLGRVIKNTNTADSKEEKGKKSQLSYSFHLIHHSSDVEDQKQALITKAQEQYTLHIKPPAKKIMYGKSTGIDNPGGGDCAFYAFAVGLLPILQRDSVENNRMRLDKLKWVIEKSGMEWKNFEDEIAECTEYDYIKNEKTKEILKKLNVLLREIVVSEKEQSLETDLMKDFEADTIAFNAIIEKKGKDTQQQIDFQPSINKIQDNAIFSDALGIFYYHYDSQHYNRNVQDSDIGHDEVANAVIRETALSIKELEKDSNITLTDNEKKNILKMRLLAVPSKENECKQTRKEEKLSSLPQQREKQEEEQKKDPKEEKKQEKKEQSRFLTTSAIGKLLAKKRQLGVWGTEADLGYLADFFDISLIIHRRGRAVHPKADSDIKPNICINHHIER